MKVERFLRSGWVSGSCGIVASVFLLGLALPAQAQPPERFRLDLTTTYLQTKRAAVVGGRYVPRFVVVRPVTVLLFDVSATANPNDRLSLSAGVPFGLLFESVETRDRDRVEFGLADVRAGAGYRILNESPYLPAMTLSAEGGAPTASVELLGSDQFRGTGRISLSKSLHPRFTISADGGYSHFFDRRGVETEPIWSFGGGVGMGVTESMVLSLQVEQSTGGERKQNGRVVAGSSRDLRATMGTTFFSKGRPRVTFAIGAGNLADKPDLFISLRFALLSF